jgi:hypothetical protein
MGFCFFRGIIQFQKFLLLYSKNANSVSYQKVDYRYNIRGWLKAINNIDNLIETGENEDLFAFKINYNEIEQETNYVGKELYNGNISRPPALQSFPNYH